MKSVSSNRMVILGTVGIIDRVDRLIHNVGSVMSHKVFLRGLQLLTDFNVGPMRLVNLGVDRVPWLTCLGFMSECLFFCR